MNLDERIADAHARLDDSIDRLITAPGKTHAGTVALFSGGNDSKVLAHLFRERVDALGHCNTGIGIEQTRVFVRQRAADWNRELIEVHPPSGSSYVDLVLDHGFPGPGQHFKMYQRLKERGLRQIRKMFVGDEGRKRRVVFLAGRRRAESQRRANIPEDQAEGSVVWVSPLVDWTDADMAAYSARFALPRNEVSDMLHMSGECLCGAFARKDELVEIAFFFPDVAEHLMELEALVRATGRIAPYRCRWGWGGDPEVLKSSRQRPSRSGLLCSDCDLRADA